MIRNLLSKILGDDFTENNEKFAKINFLIILLMFIVSVVMLFFLPDEISILHTGDTDYPIPTILGIWLCPIVALIVNFSFIMQKRLSAMNTGIMALLFFLSTGYYFTLM